MDLNPTFGHQELFETLSQGSNKSSKSPGTGSSSHRSESHARKSSSSSTKSGSMMRAAQQQQQQMQEREQLGSIFNMTTTASLQEAAAAGNVSAAAGRSVQGSLPFSAASQPTGASSLSHVDEAYRRLGQRLSLQAHGDMKPESARRSRMMLSPFRHSQLSSFERYTTYSHATAGANNQRPTSARAPLNSEERPSSLPPNALGAAVGDGASEESAEGQGRFRTTKVAKKGYLDQGEHHVQSMSGMNGSLLKRLTVEAKQSFEMWERTHKAMRKRRPTAMSAAQQVASNSSSSSTSNLHHQHSHDGGFNLARLALDTPNSFSGPLGGSAARRSRQNHLMGVGGAPPTGAKGLLSAVLEGHSDSNTSASGAIPADRSAHTSPSQSISTKDSRTMNSSHNGGGNLAGANGGHQPQSQRDATGLSHRGRCLTSPSEPVTNDGLDNVEGNLIVYENDIISIQRKSLHSIHKKDRDTIRSAEYRIMSLLGQGTFAQVFKCLHVQTGQYVAIKVVKNKPAYTRQAAVEIDIFRALHGEDDQQELNQAGGASKAMAPSSRPDNMVGLVNFFMHRSHLCLVFEVLGLNLYDVLKRRQFRGLPISMVRELVVQVLSTFRDLAQKGIVHCDLKPENVLLVSDTVAKDVINAGETRRPAGADANTEAATIESSGSKATSSGSSSAGQTIQATNIHSKPHCMLKLIDFGSACFEGFTAHTYIQSRFYRSPEVLIGLPYDSAIDMWSLGCVAAELFLGLPILPGVHEHDQLGRITEMIGKIPDWMLDQGSKSTKYYVKFVSRPTGGEVTLSSATRTPSPGLATSGSPGPPIPQWRLKTQQEYLFSLSQSEIRKRGGLAKLEKQPGNRYFKRDRLADIVALHAQHATDDDKKLVSCFSHFLHGLLDPDPWKRWTAYQAVQHPFVTGEWNQLSAKASEFDLDPKEENLANLELEWYWRPPWDPSICRRKLLNVQKMREKQQAMRRSGGSRSASPTMSLSEQSSRWNRTGESNGSVVGVSDTTMMDTSTSSLAHGQRGLSPPNQVSSSGSTAASYFSKQAHGATSATADMGEQPTLAYYQGTTSSSWTYAALPGNRERVALDDSVGAEATSMNLASGPAFVSGPQSFTSAAIDVGRGGVAVVGDFAYALQRPGVVPGAGTDMSVASQHSGIVEMSPQESAGQYYQYGAGGALPRNSSSNSMPQLGGMMPGGDFVDTARMTPQSYASAGPGFDMTIGAGSNYNAANPYFASGVPMAIGSSPGSSGYYGSYGLTPQGSSANSSLTMPDALGGGLPDRRSSLNAQHQARQSHPSSTARQQDQQQPQQYQQQQEQPQQHPQQHQQQQLQMSLLLQQQQQEQFQRQQMMMMMMQQQQALAPSGLFLSTPGGGLASGAGSSAASDFQQPNSGLMSPSAGPVQPTTAAPVYLAGGAGGGGAGGYYYVATSANGQPVLLQPVAFLNPQQTASMASPQQAAPQQPEMMGGGMGAFLAAPGHMMMGPVPMAPPNHGAGPAPWAYPMTNPAGPAWVPSQQQPQPSHAPVYWSAPPGPYAVAPSHQQQHLPSQPGADSWSSRDGPADSSRPRPSSKSHHHQHRSRQHRSGNSM